MIKFCRQNQSSVLNKICVGQLDAVAMSTSNLVDEIMRTMHQRSLLQCVEDGFDDKRANNSKIPFQLILISAIAAKMKLKTSLSDIPYAITDHRTLSQLGYNLMNSGRSLNSGLMSESNLRSLIGKYQSSELSTYYNNVVQNYILPKMDLLPNIHILDCTKLEVNIYNKNYEKAGIVRDDDDKLTRGYKLSTLRGLTKDSGIIEDIRLGSINTHDLALSVDMLLNSPTLKPNDILINDRGFLSREMLNYLKTHRNIDTYIPLRKNMEAYNIAVLVAKDENNWSPHPNKKRKKQLIAFVPHLEAHWFSDNPKDDVEINACVVWDTVKNEYFVFITTDTSKTAKQIIMTYELRPEIEEDYRQLKDFWKLEDFKSTQIHLIAFHIICVLFGYLFFQLYTMLPEGEQYARKSLPAILKNYIPKVSGNFIFYSNNEFAILSIIEFADLYSSCNAEIKLLIRKNLES